MILPWIIIPLFILYSLLIIYYWQSWKAVPVYIPASQFPHTKLSVIIPARNEEKNIGSLLKALEAQTYPRDLIEIIVIDDHSEDRTAEIAGHFARVKLLKPENGDGNAYKKKAIETGIAAATGELIITTDADCCPPPDWLEIMACFYFEKKSAFIAAPVVINSNKSLLQVFQAMDFMVLQGITAAVVHNKKLSMCNGANLAYERNAFYEVNGFAGIDHIASGDDMLLMHKINEKYPERVHYLLSRQAIVSTEPQLTWKAFFNQRIRWASKAGQYEDKRLFPVLLLVYLFNLCFPLLLIAGFIDYRYWFGVLLLWLAKTTIELPFFISVSRFFDRQWTIKWFFFFQPLHIFYSLLSGLFGQFGKYEWKGRTVK